MDFKKILEIVFLYLKNNPLRSKIENLSDVSKPIADAVVSGTEKTAEAIKENGKGLEKILSRIEVMKGEPGEKPTEKELLTLIEPLIPPKAEDGYTPVKFKDYFTKEEQKEFVDAVFKKIKIPEVKNGITPVAGVDFPTHEQVAKYCDELIAEIPKPKDGLTPEHEWKGTKVRFKNSDGTWGKWTELKGKDGDNGKKTTIFGNDGAKFFRDLLDVPRGYDGQAGKVVSVKSTEDGIRFTTAGAGSGVVETIVAGDGISVDSTDPANPIVTAEVTQAELDAKADDSAVVHDTGDETVAGVKTFSSDPIIPDEVYGAGWNGSLEPPTKNAVYDKIETLSAGSGTVETIVAGNNIDVDATDPANPIVSVETLTLADISDVTATASEVNVLDGIPATLTATELGYVDGVTSAIQTQLNAKAADADVVHDTGDETIAGVKTFSSDPIIPDEAYGVGWNGSLEPATKNAIYDKIETLPGGHDAVTVTDSAEIDFTLTGQNITASLIAGSIDETKLDASTNASLDLADSSLQAANISDTAYDATSWNGVTTVAPSKNAVRDKIETLQPLDTELTALAGLTSAADKGIQFTGAGTAGTFDLTTAAKTVLDDATVAAMVDTLGGASSTGTGGLVRATSPTLVTPALGTPSALVLTNATGLPTAGLVDDAVTYAKIQNVSATDRVLGRTTAGAGDIEEIATTGSGNVVRATSPTLVTPALGTPSALVLTNATGLPLSSVVDSTTEALGVGSLEVGHASDTTISRSAAGTIAVEGVDVLTTSNTKTISNKSVSGALTLEENASIALDPAGSADGKYSGITVTGTAGYTQAFGDLVYLDPTDSRWEATDANAAAAADGDARGILGMVVVAGTDGNSCTILLNGIIRADANFPALTIGAPVYVAETAGDIVVAQPTTTDAVIRIVGAALTADEIFFRPDFHYTTHT